jgi:hypothetical protein
MVLTEGGNIINMQKQGQDTRLPGYFAVIPATIRYDNDIPSGAKLLYGEITALCSKEGYCWAGNAYFADLYQKDERTIRNWINALRNKGHIIVAFKYKAGSKEIETRMIRLPQPYSLPLERNEPDTGKPETITPQDSEQGDAGGGENNFPTYGKKFPQVGKIFSTGGEKNFRDNITNINTATATTADTPNSGADPPTSAVAALLSTRELKDAFAETDANLVFDRDFYPKAAAFMAENGLERPYLSWLFKQCERKNPRSLDGLYFKLFFAGNMVEKFKAMHKAAAPPQTVCPVCGLSHSEHDGQCPSCGLKRGATDAEIHNERELFNLPPDKRAAYRDRQAAIVSECGSNFIKANPLFESLDKEFGISRLT